MNSSVHRSQSAKTNVQGGSDGYDAAKKLTGRKRHILVDTMELTLAVVVHAARNQDRNGAKVVFERLGNDLPRLQLSWADGGYARKLVEWIKSECGWVLEIVKRAGNVKAFKLLPRRWVVQRTFAWLRRIRRMGKDYEFHPETSESTNYLDMIKSRVRRLATACTTQHSKLLLKHAHLIPPRACFEAGLDHRGTAYLRQSRR